MNLLRRAQGRFRPGREKAVTALRRGPAEDDQRLPRHVAAEGEAAIRTVVDTARLTGSGPFGTILKTVSA